MLILPQNLCRETPASPWPSVSCAKVLKMLMLSGGGRDEHIRMSMTELIPPNSFCGSYCKSHGGQTQGLAGLRMVRSRASWSFGAHHSGDDIGVRLFWIEVSDKPHKTEAGRVESPQFVESVQFV